MLAATVVLFGVVSTVVDLTPRVDQQFFFSSNDPQLQESKKIDQRFPAGDYPNQHPGGDGLPAWTAADRALENTDLVLWHTFTAHHVVRPEDWPVMPVTRVGFQLRADGFFDGNPALDVPPAEHCHHEG